MSTPSSLFSHNQGRFKPSQTSTDFVTKDGGQRHAAAMRKTASTADRLAHVAMGAEDLAEPYTPTLRRYAKFNNAMSSSCPTQFSRLSELPMVKIEMFTTPSSGAEEPPTVPAVNYGNTPSNKRLLPKGNNGGSTASLLMDDEEHRKNWLLLDRGLELKQASVNRGSAFVWLDTTGGRRKLVNQSMTMNGKDKRLTMGNLKLFKIGKQQSDGIEVQRNDDAYCDQHCCNCCTKLDDKNLHISNSAKVRPSILPQSFSTESPEAPPISPTSSSSGNSKDNNCHHSCPDLLEPCINREISSESLLSSTLMRNRRKKSERKSWKYKPLESWTLDDVLLWLQSVGLEEVTSVLIGYELNGSDVDKWDESTLISLGISDSEFRNRTLLELQKLKLLLTQNCNNINSPKNSRKSSNQRCYSLFPLINDCKYDRILSFELPPTTSVRDFTVATDPMEWALVVTGSKPGVLLAKGDLIIELNGISCIKLPPVDFNKLMHELNGHKYQLVVLRRSETNNYTKDNNYVRL